MKKAFNSALKIFQNYLWHAFVAVVAAVIARYGYHVSVPVLPVSVASFTGLFSLRTILQNLAQSWHTGRLQAELEHQAKQDIMGIVNSLLSPKAMSSPAEYAPAEAAEAPPAAAPKAA